jgi:hypothetical protein
MNPDGMSYLDMASEALRGGPQNLVNGYWSPAYPALISLALFIFRPSPNLEFPVIHIVNFVIFGFVLLSFTFFLKSWLAVRRDGDDPSKEEAAHIIPFCFCVFLYFTIDFITLSLATPDLCVAGIVFLAAGICCRISLPGTNWRRFAALGAILALGYYAKTAMFPLGLILLALLFVWPPSGNYNRLKVVLAGFVFLIVAAPQAALVSSRVGRLSIGETGRLNYAWYVNGLQPFVGWTTGGINHAHGTPEHPPRTLLERPTVLEFADTVTGTYPLWYDPSYWYSGATVRFDLQEQLAALRTNLIVYWHVFMQVPSLFAGAFVLCIFVFQQGILPTSNRDLQWLLTWPIAVCSMYAAVHVENRFLGAFFVLFWLALYRLLLQRLTYVVRVAVVGTVLCTMFVPATAAWLAASAMAVRDLIRANQPDYILVGDALKAAGVNPGDRLATAGTAFDAYYARYTGARIVAHIVVGDEFRYLSAEDLGRVRDRLAGIGVKALVTTDRPVNAVSAAWKEVMVSGSLRYSIMLVTTSTPAAK